MEFRNNGNNKYDKKKSMNTRGLQLMNGDSPDHPSTMSLGWWDNFLTLSISPALEANQRREGQFFNYDIAANTALSPEKCLLLKSIIDDYIRPAIEAGDETLKAIPIGGNSLLCVGTKKFGADKVRPYVVMHKNLNAETMKPELSLIYIFKSDNQIIHDYDENTGKFTSGTNELLEFNLFAKVLDYAATNLTMGTAHAERYVNRYSNSNLKSTVDNIAMKVGADVVGFTSAPRAYGGKNIFNGGNGNTSTANNVSDGFTEDEELKIEHGLDDLPF